MLDQTAPPPKPPDEVGLFWADALGNPKSERYPAATDRWILRLRFLARVPGYNVRPGFTNPEHIDRLWDIL